MFKLAWTEEMRRALLQSMVEAVRNGKRAESGFKKEAWIQALKEVHTRIKHNFRFYRNGEDQKQA